MITPRKMTISMPERKKCLAILVEAGMDESEARVGLNRLLGAIMNPTERVLSSREKYDFPWGPEDLHKHGLLSLLRTLLDKVGFHPVGSFVGARGVRADRVFRTLCKHV